MHRGWIVLVGDELRVWMRTRMRFEEVVGRWNEGTEVERRMELVDMLTWWCWCKKQVVVG